MISKKHKYTIQLIVFLYVVHAISFFIPITKFGIIPRTFNGLIGVFASPFLHADIWHLISNTLPLIVLLTVLNFFYPKKTLSVIIFIILVGGMFVWMFARSANHIGASGLIYGLASFLIANGILERKFIPILVSIAVAVVYGGLIWGLVPSLKSHISWEGHLFGAVAGILAAFLLKKKQY
ncbi:rhomboid family intramembrane serine protease [Tenacibaculum finnmarkense genomovar finnmarkense]|uniref:Rhomboid family intramembrane serine protease n=1 Tax=Tenacibaculum finnmarkense genomovar finnmarkense TaxID=1458503 RepID=A0AAP1WFQ2_9FLAO|nr:rhomboid family intramembrane serine protease [Tenacibaculum finnmarkense]MBE7652288.1 rhomboid family intramembrane serine protease [Tenacibaculum finnmarkense genomovar finnmarkense]MBE7694540.1 rhomboid family intramembrane serine protease [Tenacibaculum finnmarkense genomovar finnmarkense]MCD8417990.1 rhomboid family intramembrane serine protease [Tenacibaculum finnmarkense genomovar finnmarkense]MCD8426727.1 rhomboid family intramembrane serine protease [Tenacibaculum finnmarkense genom